MTPVPNRVAGVGDAYAVNENGVLVAALPSKGVLGNDFNNTGQPLTATLQDDVDHGFLEFSEDGTFNYVPLTGYHSGGFFPAPDSFTYTACAGALCTAPTTATITVRAISPTATFEAPTTVTGSPFVITFANPEGQVQNGLTNIVPANLTITPDGSSTPLAGTMVCKNSLGLVLLDCSTGVSSVVFSPSSPLTAGKTYHLDLNNQPGLGVWICQVDLFGACLGPQRLSDAVEIVDTTKPTVTITAEAPSTGGALGDWHNIGDLGPDQKLDVTVTPSDGPGGSGIYQLACQVDSSPVTTSGTQFLGPFADGTHSVSCAATDHAGNVTQPAVAKTYKIDSTPPSITASATRTDGQPYVAGTPSDLDVTVVYECSDPGAGASGIADCAADQVFTSSGVAEGAAEDLAGNQSSAVFGAVTIEQPPPLPPPDTAIDSGPSGLTSSRTATFSFSSLAAGVTFECKRDGAAFASCLPGVAYDALADGAHTFAVRAVRAGGAKDPTPATRTWTVDGTAPEATILTGPPAETTATTAAFTFSSAEAGVTFLCRLDGGQPAACTSPAKVTALALGTHSFEVGAVDAAGNADPSPARRGWTVKAAAVQPSPSPSPSPSPGATPDTRITGGPRRTRSRRPAFAFKSSPAGATFLCKVDRGPYRACRSGAKLRRLARGRHKLYVKAVSAAGTADPTPAVRRFRIV